MIFFYYLLNYSFSVIELSTLFLLFFILYALITTKNNTKKNTFSNKCIFFFNFLKKAIKNSYNYIINKKKICIYFFFIYLFFCFLCHNRLFLAHLPQNITTGNFVFLCFSVLMLFFQSYHFYKNIRFILKKKESVFFKKKTEVVINILRECRIAYVILLFYFINKNITMFFLYHKCSNFFLYFLKKEKILYFVINTMPSIVLVFVFFCESFFFSELNIFYKLLWLMLIPLILNFFFFNLKMACIFYIFELLLYYKKIPDEHFVQDFIFEEKIIFESMDFSNVCYNLNKEAAQDLYFKYVTDLYFFLNYDLVEKKYNFFFSCVNIFIVFLFFVCWLNIVLHNIF